MYSSSEACGGSLNLVYIQYIYIISEYAVPPPYDCCIWKICQANVGPGKLEGFPLCEIHGSCEDWMCSSHLAPQQSEGLAPRWESVCKAQREILDGRDGRAVCAGPKAFKLPTDPTLDILKCSCGLPLRPCVLMFGDEDEVLLSTLREAWAKYQAWEDQMENEVEASGGHLVILEIGVGRRVEVVRQECEEVLKDVVVKGGTVTSIQINLDAKILSQPLAAQDGSGRVRKVGLQMSSLEALKLIAEVDTNTASPGNSILPACLCQSVYLWRDQLTKHSWKGSFI